MQSQSKSVKRQRLTAIFVLIALTVIAVDRLTGLPDQPDRALPEVPIELPACLCHRPVLPLRRCVHVTRGSPLSDAVGLHDKEKVLSYSCNCACAAAVG